MEALACEQPTMSIYRVDVAVISEDRLQRWGLQRSQQVQRPALKIPKQQYQDQHQYRHRCRIFHFEWHILLDLTYIVRSCTVFNLHRLHRKDHGDR